MRTRPPSLRLDRCRFEGASGAVGGTAILDDGTFVRFESLDGLARDQALEVVALQLDGHIGQGGSS